MDSLSEQHAQLVPVLEAVQSQFPVKRGKNGRFGQMDNDFYIVQKNRNIIEKGALSERIYARRENLDHLSAEGKR